VDPRGGLRLVRRNLLLVSMPVNDCQACYHSIGWHWMDCGDIGACAQDYCKCKKYKSMSLVSDTEC